MLIAQGAAHPIQSYRTAAVDGAHEWPPVAREDPVTEEIERFCACPQAARPARWRDIRKRIASHAITASRQPHTTRSVLDTSLGCHSVVQLSASCVFCIYSSRSGLVQAARLHPELAAQYAAVEADIGHRFRVDVSMAEVVADATTTDTGPVADWID